MADAHRNFIEMPVSGHLSWHWPAITFSVLLERVSVSDQWAKQDFAWQTVFFKK